MYNIVCSALYDIYRVPHYYCVLSGSRLGSAPYYRHLAHSLSLVLTFALPDSLIWRLKYGFAEREIITETHRTF